MLSHLAGAAGAVTCLAASEDEGIEFIIRHPSRTWQKLNVTANCESARLPSSGERSSQPPDRGVAACGLLGDYKEVVID
ncbi:hypothetical protein [Mesorhizobium sp.]|uniref:hypothetical protein n=1 Tax=Mesorhizobium sp. TaxID=1871066 RepID=UPI000FE66027|nr:hypothetical protein [Mesorhizobium sp.]RWJ05740.1 MAG: hypothetical protein EOR23_07850 [Mesorhizobium sp.]